MHYSEVLDQKDIAEYKTQGYSDEDIQTAVNTSMETIQGGGNATLQQSYQQAQTVKQADPRSLASNAFVTGKYNENLIQWQLELDSILERAEHLLRGDKPTWKDGSIIWMPPKKPEEEIFNKFGVAEIMRILSMYINRNTILSNYKEEVINEKMFDLGNELADLIFLKYEEMGLDILAKRKLYPILVRQLIDIVHSSYLRALHGGERESLREARQVTQTDTLGAGVTVNTGMPHKERGILNPLRYATGKYK